MRGFLEISQNKLPNERFARGFRQFSQRKLPKRSRARLPRNFAEQASKTSVSHDASGNFLRKSFQNDRFVRCFFKFSQNKLAKKIVSCEASSNFQRTSFQNERFAGCFRQFSQKKLPKRSFRARLPPNFIEQCFQNERFVRGFLEISQNKLPKRNLRFATVSCHRPTESYEGSSSKSKMCVSLQRRVIPHFKIHVLLQRRTQKCINQAQEARANTRHANITILPQF